MKNLSIGFFLLGATFFTISCKKESNPIETGNELGVANGVIVNSRGYLSFKSSNDIVEFGKRLNSSKKESIMSDLRKKGFKSRSNSSSFSRAPNSIYNLIFNEEGLLQVDDVIMKITDDDKFLYTLKEGISDSVTFNKLLNEIYDGLKMNKINVDRSLLEEFNLIDFTAENPFGELEALYNADQKRPMFGGATILSSDTDPAFYNTGTGQCEQCTNYYSQSVTYIFWIALYGELQFTGQVCHSVPTCK